ncbi:hypothetical protein VOI32_00825 [Paraburkholderia caribensis]|uniref:Uncharacterized protein n=1 Tax=Paraburkholderia caribensis TaxID=75105 RepID=A0A9Q6WKL5_9BURK|nr:hypothetical protein [Paraburkholderia caribensis]MCO4875572.1 hypothetical protein [Paraburkholderia caribensis]PTB30509.1 hypothetical protein C9I56_01815 [Paraburkholderia caribensis]QLB62250.1 hypothetical protein A9O66_07570 [Paraburkholderia caribensis]
MTVQPPKSDQIYVLGSLQRLRDHYSFVIRWMLGASDDRAEQHNSLPRDNERFAVAVRRGSGTYLQADGKSWGAEYEYIINARPFAMLDPPRIAAPVPEYGDADHQWLIAAEPAEPVNPAIDPDEGLRDANGSRALGVVHLVCETDQARVAWRLYQIFHRAIANRTADLASHAAFAGSSFDTEHHEAARELALFAVRSRRRIATLPALFAAEVNAFHQRHVDGYAPSGGGESPLLSPDLPADKMWRRAALVSVALGDSGSLELADRINAQARQLRAQLRMRALQGGTMIDFWGGLDSALAHVPAQQRGVCYPAAELLGLGCTLGNFTEAQVRAWATLPRGTAETISISVRQLPIATRTFAPVSEMCAAGFLPYGSSEQSFTPGSTLVYPQGINAALGPGGSSSPLPAPRAAKVNYDLTRTYVDTSAVASLLDMDVHGPGLAFGTGDARIEVLITPPAPVPDGNGNSYQPVVGFNVYGVWEGASAASDAWFDAEVESVALADLKPWLITRRYSYERDLKTALADVSGMPHPALGLLLSDPPWHPVLIRSSIIEDHTRAALAGEPVAQLPNVVNCDETGAPLTVWTYDLRQGMRAGRNAPAGLTTGWDPAYPVDSHWTPELWRGDDPSHTPPRSRPQRYRFWVSSVDAMEQESEPVPVDASDPAFGEATFAYSPRVRTQIAPPPQGPGAADALTIELLGDLARSGLRISFGTPQQFLLGGHETSDSPPPKLAPDKLEARVYVLRRRLVRKVIRNEPTHTIPVAGLLAGDPVVMSPPWTAMLEKAAADGWQPWALQTATCGQHDERWRAEFSFSHLDRGFEYRALVGFAVCPAFMPFWMPATASRRVQSSKKANDGKFQLEIATISECPAVGAVIATEPVAVVNKGFARKVDAPQRSGTTVWATPVLPPPGVDRDLVLMRLLFNPTADGIATDGEPELARFLGISPAITAGQALMCARALERLKFGDGETPAADDLALVRTLLVRDFLNTAGANWSNRLRQHATIGFRGVEHLRWSYTPLSVLGPAQPASPEEDTDAEAVAFRVFCARAPRSGTATQSGAIEMDLVCITGTRYRVTPRTGTPVDALRLLTSGRQPVLVRLTTDGSAPVFATAGQFEGPDGRPATVLLSMQAGAAAPTQAKADIFVGAHLTDVANETFDRIVDHDVYVPVGGGPSEVVVWWIVPVSAQENFSPPTDWFTVFRQFPATVKALAPRMPLVRSVLTVKDPALDPSRPEDRPWCPTGLSSAMAALEPRLYVAWEADDFPDDDMLIEIDRISRAVAGSHSALHAMQAFEEWHAIRSIETIKDDEPLPGAWAEAAGRNWLRGRQVERDSDGSEQTKPYIGVERALKGNKGLAPVLEPSGKRAMPTFIDYYAPPNDNRDAVMASDYEHSYRIRISQLVDAMADPDWRYLESDWSSWSPYVLPVRPSLNIQAATPARSPLNGITPPSILLSFIAGAHASIARDAWRADVSETRYRIIVQRKVRSALVQTSNDAGDHHAAWFELGGPLELSARSGAPATQLLDDGFERDDLHAALEVHYRIQVVHYAIGAGGVERPIRKQAEDFFTFSITVPPPASSGRTFAEWQLLQTINIW